MTIKELYATKPSSLFAKKPSRSYSRDNKGRFKAKQQLSSKNQLKTRSIKLTIMGIEQKPIIVRG